MSFSEKQISELKETLGLKKDQCTSMAELRDEIDMLDQKMVELMMIRSTFMHQAAHIKKDRNTVRDHDRVEDVMCKVSEYAVKVGADPNLVSDIYRMMIEWSINYEFDRFDELKKILQD